MTKNEFETRKQAVVKSLYSIGEPNLAKDFSEATELCSFESVEYSLRERLKAKVNKRWSKVIANAIVEAQCLPHTRTGPLESDYGDNAQPCSECSATGQQHYAICSQHE